MTIDQRRLAATFAALLAGIVLLGSSCKLANKAPSVPTLSGPTTGVAGVALTFTATATDPESDSLQFQFDWGDGATPAWTAFVASGDTITATNTYADSGTFTVKARAKDSNGKESDWSTGQALSILPAGGTYPDSVYGQISMDFGAVAGVITPNGQYMYTAHAQGYNVVTPIRLADRAVLPSVPVDANPRSLAVAPDGTELFVACTDAGTIVAIDIPSNVVRLTTPVGPGVRSLAVTNDGQFVLALISDDHRLLKLRASDLTAVDTIEFPSAPDEMRLAPSGNWAYVTLAYSVQIIDVMAFELSDSMASVARPGAMALSFDGQLMFVGSITDSGFVVLRLSDKTVLAHVYAGDAFMGGFATTADGAYVFGTDLVGLRTYDTRAFALVDSMTLVTHAELAMHPDGDTLYVIGRDRVFVLARSR